MNDLDKYTYPTHLWDGSKNHREYWEWTKDKLNLIWDIERLRNLEATHQSLKSNGEEK